MIYVDEDYIYCSEWQFKTWWESEKGFEKMQ